MLNINIADKYDNGFVKRNIDDIGLYMLAKKHLYEIYGNPMTSTDLYDTRWQRK